MNSQKIFPSKFFKRSNEEDDALFYSSPRFLTYLDEVAIQNLSNVLFKILPSSGIYLDLMSSWHSHFPNELMPTRVIGVGLNSSEMAKNPQLDEYVVQDLNKIPFLPFGNGEMDAVICTISIQYLTKPIEIFAEVNRILKPGGVFVVSFSKSYFSAKAIAAWIATTNEQHIQIVVSYFKHSSNWTQLRKKVFIPKNSDPLYTIWAYKA